MIYRILTGAIVLALCGLAIMMAPSTPTTTAPQQAQPAQQAPTPATKSEDDALKGIKFQ
jgi:hypothetical protein